VLSQVVGCFAKREIVGPTRYDLDHSFIFFKDQSINLLIIIKISPKSNTNLLTYKIVVGEGTFAIHLLVFEITPTKKMIDSKQRIVTLIEP
jgi:hypothetical protein